jgi:hypothetical protein
MVFEAETSEPVLLEINVYPAVAGGTMGAVPRGIFARTVNDTLHLLAPILDNPQHPAAPPLGGFVDLAISPFD